MFNFILKMNSFDIKFKKFSYSLNANLIQQQYKILKLIYKYNQQFFHILKNK